MVRLVRPIGLSVFALCAGASLAPAQFPQPYEAAVVANSDTTALVSVEVTAVRESPRDGTSATLKILHVYSGPKSLKGLAFFQGTTDQGNRNRRLAVPLLKVGEIGIWRLHIDEKTGTWTPSVGARKAYARDWDRAVERAETVENLATLGGAKRLELAKELCADKRPEIARIGFDVLFGAKPEDAERAGIPKFLNELPKNRDVTPSALIRADQRFWQRDGKDWLDSDRRKALLERFTDPLTDEDAEEAIGHIRGSQYFESPDGSWLTVGQAVELLTKIATDPRQPATVRSIAVKQVVEGAAGAGVKPGFTFEVLVAVVRRGTGATRLEAAQGLARFARPAVPNAAPTYTPAQLDIFRDLLKDEKDADVAKTLAAALAKSK